MNRDDFQDELLSAWFDGETTAEESAAAENLLAESPAARRAVLEFAQLSAWIRELPAGSRAGDGGIAAVAAPAAGNGAASGSGGGPAELARSSSSRLDPETMGRGRATVRAAAVPASDRRPHGRRSAGVAVGLAAATLLVCVGLLWRTGDHATQLADATRGPAAEFAPPEVREQPADIAMSEGWESYANAKPLPAAPASELLASRGGGNAFRRESAAMRFARRRPEAGEVLQLVEQGGDGLRLVEVSVVDVQQAAGVLEVLLTKNAIPPAPDADDDQLRSREAHRTDRDEELVAVYVETTEQQFSAVLEQIAREPVVVSLQSDAPIVAMAVGEDTKWNAGAAAPFQEEIGRSALRGGQSVAADAAQPAAAPRAESAAPRAGGASPVNRSRSAPPSAPAAFAPAGRPPQLGTSADVAASPADRANSVADGGTAAAAGSWQARVHLPAEAARKLVAEVPQRVATERDRQQIPRGLSQTRVNEPESRTDNLRQQSASDLTVRALFLLRRPKAPASR